MIFCLGNFQFSSVFLTTKQRVGVELVQTVFEFWVFCCPMWPCMGLRIMKHTLPELLGLRILELENRGYVAKFAGTKQWASCNFTVKLLSFFCFFSPLPPSRSRVLNCPNFSEPTIRKLLEMGFDHQQTKFTLQFSMQPNRA